MRQEFKDRLKFSPLSRFLTLPRRLGDAVPYLLKRLARGVSWAISAREYVNYSYDYEDRGIESLAALIGSVARVAPHLVRAYADEFRQDAVFRQRHMDRMANHPVRHISQPQLHFGKTLLYYCLIRACRPKVVFEAGTERGFGALAICRALAKNAQDGFPGHLTTIDIDARRGEFLEGDEGGLVTRMSGDSVAALENFDAAIDCFIHDTMNTVPHCRAQYAALEPHLAHRAVIFSVYFEPEFRAFCERNGFPHCEYIELPKDHWSPGRNCGIALGMPLCPRTIDGKEYT